MDRDQVTEAPLNTAPLRSVSVSPKLQIVRDCRCDFAHFGNVALLHSLNIILCYYHRMQSAAVYLNSTWWSWLGEVRGRGGGGWLQYLGMTLAVNWIHPPHISRDDRGTGKIKVFLIAIAAATCCLWNFLLFSSACAHVHVCYVCPAVCVSACAPECASPSR